MHPKRFVFICVLDANDTPSVRQRVSCQTKATVGRGVEISANGLGYSCELLSSVGRHAEFLVEQNLRHIHSLLMAIHNLDDIPSVIQKQA